MDFILAIKVFFKALTDRQGAKRFLETNQSERPERGDYSHLRLLSLLQTEGRLVDFLKEDIAGFSDTQIGAAVRQIHGECNKAIEEFVTLRPLFQEPEGANITLNQGFDMSAVKLIGTVKGAPPYQGILRHRGWIAHKLSLPVQIDKGNHSVVCQAEIEIK